MNERVTAARIRNLKGISRIAAVTAVDWATARWCDEAGVDIVLVGDSLGMVSLGLSDTTAVTLDMMVHHTAAAARGIEKALLVADMPFLSASVSVEETVKAAGRLIAEGRAQAVKIESHEAVPGAIRAVVAAGIPVMAHVGLTPQAIHRIGGFRVQGRNPEAADMVVAAARTAEEEGAFSCVIEAVPSELGRRITDEISIPTIGIGAGPDTDGQILVLHDILGIFDRFRPRFVRKYADLGSEAMEAISRYAEDVRSGAFPSADESFS